MYVIVLKISWALRSSWMQICKPSTNTIKGTFFKMVDEDGDKPSPKFTCHDDFYRSVRGKNFTCWPSTVINYQQISCKQLKAELKNIFLAVSLQNMKILTSEWNVRF